MRVVGPGEAEAAVPGVTLVDLAPGAADAIATIGSIVGAGRPAGVRFGAVGSDERSRGAAIGLLTAALAAGAVVVEAHDPRLARRVVAVFEAWSGAAGPGARMAR